LKIRLLHTSKSADNLLFFCIFKIDQIINDHEWTTNNALLFSDEIASKPCNHNLVQFCFVLTFDRYENKININVWLYLAICKIINNLTDKISMCGSIKVSVIARSGKEWNIVPVYNVHPCYKIKNLGKILRIMHH
jgi:hypothetical protein